MWFEKSPETRISALGERGGKREGETETERKEGTEAEKRGNGTTKNLRKELNTVF